MRISAVLMALVLAVCGAANAGELKTRSFQLPSHGAVELQVPASWKDSVRQPPDNLPPTITFTASTGNQFQVIVTLIWPMRSDIKPPTSEELSRSVQAVAKDTAQNSVEKILEVKGMGHGSNVGYYFAATDPAPKPGEYKYLNQGMMRLDDLRVAFTILTNDGQADVVDQAITMLSNAMRR